MQDRIDQYYIPDNLSSRRKFFGIPNRNLIEAAVVEIVLFLIIRVLPLSIPLIVTAVIFMLGIGILLVMGIHHESVTEYIATTIKFNARKAKYHLRKVNQDEKVINEGQEEKVISLNGITERFIKGKEKFEGEQ